MSDEERWTGRRDVGRGHDGMGEGAFSLHGRVKGGSLDGDTTHRCRARLPWFFCQGKQKWHSSLFCASLRLLLHHTNKHKDLE